MRIAKVMYLAVFVFFLVFSIVHRFDRIVIDKVVVRCRLVDVGLKYSGVKRRVG